MTVSIPTAFDGALSEIDDLNSLVLVRLRNWHHGPPDQDQKHVTSALKDYVHAVAAILNAQ